MKLLSIVTMEDIMNKPMTVVDLVQEYRELTEQIVDINKRRYVLAQELLKSGIKVPALDRLTPEGIS